MAEASYIRTSTIDSKPVLFIAILNEVVAIKEGNEFVFQQVFQQYHSKLYYFIYGKTKSAFLSEEIVQTTFIKLWKYRERLNEQLSVSIQIYRIAHTSLIDEMRKQQTNNQKLQAWQRISTRTLDNNGPQSIDEKALLKTIHDSIAALPPMQQKVFKLSREEGHSYKEIATILSISPKTVEIHISKALKFLRQKLGLLIGLLVLFYFINGND